MTELIDARTAGQIATIRELFVEYARSLGFDLCFQSFDKELADLPGDYARPEGRLLLAEHDGKVAGCVALRKSDEGVCEMKRLWVRPEFRGLKIGRALAEKIIEEARRVGYTKMRLDTIATMKEAISLYKSLGFVPAEPYYHNPIDGVVYFELEL